MKLYRYILVLMLLLGMTATAVQSLCGDDKALSKAELSKKSGDTEPEDGSAEDGDVDGDDDIDDILNGFFDFDWSTYNIETELYDYSNQKYLSTTVTITTPPPKV